MTRWIGQTALLWIALALSLPVAAAQPEVVDGVAVYMGVVPAEIVSEHAPQHIDPQMPWGADWRHVMVAVFDAESGARLTGAEVTALVSGPDGDSVRRRLEPMVLGSTITYGDYFRLPAPGLYRIRIGVRGPELQGAVEAEFEYLAQLEA